MGSALAYPLGDALIAYIYHAGGTLRGRLSLVEFLQALARAQLRGRNPSPGNAALLRRIDQVGRDIDLAWGFYEPALDDSPYHFRKRAVFTALIRLLLEEVSDIIEKGKLLDRSYMAQGGFSSPAQTKGGKKR